ncbi:MAG: hypothetical protein WA971_09110 [Microbacterium sp.]
MEPQRILQVGIDPSVIDFSPWPGQDADQLRSRIAAAEAALRDEGLAVSTCLVPDDVDAAERAVREALKGRRFDLVEIGSGLRTSHDHTPIFERVVNTVIAVQPGVRLCFNDSPETTLEAVRRGLAS